MYERMLDKSTTPAFEDLLAYSGPSRPLWEELDAWLAGTYGAAREIRFPYGNKYGWSGKYSVKKKHICDAFAEDGAFTLHFRIGNPAIDSVYPALSAYAREACDNKYPCNNGGWLHYRVLDAGQLADAMKLLAAKIEGK